MESYVREYVYSPHYDFFIDKTYRTAGYDMGSFHIHKKYEIYYQLEGTRRYFIGDSAYLINAGNIVLISEDEIHKTGSVENSAHARIVLNFNREYLEGVLPFLPEGIDLFACFASRIHVLNVSLRKQGVVESLLQRLWQDREDTSAEADALRKTQLLELLLYLNRYVGEQKQSETNVAKISNKTIDKIQSYISTHYRESLTLSQIAAQFYISPYYLSHLFKKTTNLSIVEYINGVRIMAAKNLLERGDLRVAGVSEETGFSTTAHFSRVFKESTGLSPQQYRKFYRTKVKEDT